MTITEGLAEIRTIAKRIDKKLEFVREHLMRNSAMSDPLEKDGGSEKLVKEELQAIADLNQRVVDIRLAINRANESTRVKVGDQERTVAEWLVWRRDVAPRRGMMLSTLLRQLDHGRKTVEKNALDTDPEKRITFIPHVDEKKMRDEHEMHEQILGDLDGQLSLKNATVDLDL